MLEIMDELNEIGLLDGDMLVSFDIIFLLTLPLTRRLGLSEYVPIVLICR